MFTETYIEMVINNKQIQDLWKPKKGDYIYSKEDNQICLIYHYCFSKSNEKLIFYEYINNSMHAWDDDEIIKTKHKWLPTLEDLFGMADWGHYSINKNIGDHGYYYGKENLFGEIKYPGETFSSLKEMVLAVVMEINYNKSWNGKV